MPSESDFWLNFASAVGIGILSVPAFSLNIRKKTLARIDSLVRRRKEKGDVGALSAIAAELEAEASHRANRWRWSDEICLFIGYFLLLGSATYRAFASY